MSEDGKPRTSFYDGYGIVEGLEDARVELGDYPHGKFVRNDSRAKFRITSILYDDVRGEVSVGLVDVEAPSKMESHFHVQIPVAVVDHITEVRRAERPLAP